VTWVLRLVGMWAIADALFLGFPPRRWARWWGRWIGAIGEGAVVSRMVAAVELAMGLYLLLRAGFLAAPAARRYHPGDRAMFRVELPRPVAAFFRAPALLYRLRLGWLPGHRFLMLTHRGRKSGRTYQTVLEVVHYDPRTRESIVVCALGTRADWYRNIQANPPIAVETGRDCYVPTFRELSPEETYPVIADYLRQALGLYRPIARRVIFGSLGSEEERRERARSFLLIAFRPTPESAADARPDS